MRKRIGFISEHASPLATLGHVDSGGQNVYVGQLASHLARHGYQVDVFTRRDSPDQPDIVEWKPGVRVIHVSAGPACFIPKEELLPYMEEFAMWMLKFCWREELIYSLFHANFFMSGWVAWRLKQTLGVPFVITFHALGRVRQLYQGASDGFPKERTDIEELLVRTADRIIAECPQDQEDLIRFYSAESHRMAMVPCGFDPQEFCPVKKSTARTLLGLPLKGPVLLQLGRMVPRKGIDNVIRALAPLKSLYRLCPTLVVVGGESSDTPGASEIQRLQTLAHQQGLTQQVIFAGRRDRSWLKYFYSAADVFITTPWYEPFGITPLEAMACGTPVVASAVGGLQYTVQEGRTGKLVPPKNPEALAHALGNLLSKPALAAHMGRQAMSHVYHSFTWRHVAQAVHGVYQSILPAFRVRQTLSAMYRPLAEPMMSILQSMQKMS